MTDSHQQKQKEVIDGIQLAVQSKNLPFTTVVPTADYDTDPRTCLTGVHFPKQSLVDHIWSTIITPLQLLDSTVYYYRPSSLHMTIKNIRTISNPQEFTEDDVQKARGIFENIIPSHSAFNVYFYRLLLFPNSLALIGTTDPELDAIILDLDAALSKAGIPDNKTYMNSQYFFCNMTLGRFNNRPSDVWKQKVAEISENIESGGSGIEPYLVDSVTLITGNASLVRCDRRGEWQLKAPSGA